ncbi:succinate dehydrogenase, hydrophobic membrane anchor protein [Iodidimonas sp. SYSU 1G8]|uniref:succinate dehydrogenase, hydrophobic membrane anchor protein n=1 Tax=Iodidimonas sp. SYSU 1G8 TaxID=3133967 RepID=UPI0031FF4702
MSLRSPLGKVRGLGSAKEGTHHFWVQRVSAVALVPLTLYLVASLVCLTGAGRDDVLDWLSRPFPAIMMLLLIIAGFYHLKLGLQVIIEDYVHGEGSKLIVNMLNTFGCFAAGAVAAFAVLKIAFGG